MAGAGKRFSDAGYKLRKPLIPTTERRDGVKRPMFVCALRDALEADSSARPILILRTEDLPAVQPAVSTYVPDAELICTDHLTQGQACTCLLAKERINNDEPLLIIGCDNGMEFCREQFAEAAGKSDVLVFTYRHHEAVLANPYAYGWVKTEPDSTRATGISVKKPISDTPLEDHAVVATFWFRCGSDFVRCAEEMIAADDRINGEFYADQVIAYCLKHGLTVNVFEIQKYIGWGTPEDYENYENTIGYWRQFTASAEFLPET